MYAKVSPRCLMSLGLIGFLLVFGHPGWEWASGEMQMRGGGVRRGHVGKDVYYGNPEIGKQLFTARGCVTCHAVRGVGGTLGPDLGKMFHEHNVFQSSPTSTAQR